MQAADKTPPGQCLPTVVVGGGAGGLELVTRLCRRLRGPGAGPGAAAPAGVVLVDHSLGHLWKPRLHEIATAMQSPVAAESSYLSHAQVHGYRFELGSLQAIDLEQRSLVLRALTAADGQVVLPARSIPYGRLVLALGSEENDFGTPGAKAHCLFLNTTQQAVKIRDALLVAALRLAHGQQQTLSVLIVGGGATGVELAAELRHAIDELQLYAQGLRPQQITLTVVEAADRLLSANPVPLSDYAASVLRRQNVQLVLGEQVKGVDASGVVLGNGQRIEAQLKIWTAGIQGPRVLAAIPGLPLSPSGRVRVDARLRCTGLPDVYALGDCAEWTDPATGKPAPYTAQVAAAQARYLAKALAGQAPDAAPFHFQSGGAIVSLAEHGATGNLTTRFGRDSREHFIQGASARWLYALLYRRHEVAIHGWGRALARLAAQWLAQSYQPTVKLH